VSRVGSKAIVASAGRGFITDGEDASVTVFDLKTYAVLGKVKTLRTPTTLSTTQQVVRSWLFAGTLGS